MENVTQTVNNATAAASKLIFGDGQAKQAEGSTAAGDTTTRADANPSTSTPAGTEGPSGTETASAAGTGEPTGVKIGAADPASGATPHQKQQGADRPNEEPTTAEETQAVREEKDEAESTMQKDPNDHSGEPLEKTRGAAAGASGSSEGSSSGGDQKDSMGSTSKEPGTGEKYVKSSGMAAEGGDFDASNPGAGREADRLLEDKGVHREGNKGPPQSVPDSGSSGDKPSMGQKIKDKLHIGHKD